MAEGKKKLYDTPATVFTPKSRHLIVFHCWQPTAKLGSGELPADRHPSLRRS